VRAQGAGHQRHVEEHRNCRQYIEPDKRADEEPELGGRIVLKPVPEPFGDVMQRAKLRHQRHENKTNDEEEDSPRDRRQNRKPRVTPEHGIALASHSPAAAQFLHHRSPPSPAE
jgi:hypothetical protein